MTLTKLAKLANVSVSTASKAFLMSNEVNEETREMIFAVAKENGCFKKFFNAKYPNMVIAIICPETISGFYSQILLILQRMLEEKGATVCIASNNFSAMTTEKMVKYYDRYSSVDGIIIIGEANVDKKLYETPILYVLNSNDDVNKASVGINNIDAMHQAVDYFVKNKITSIGFIGERYTVAREKKILTILDEFKIKNENYVSISDKRFAEGGYDAMEQLYKNNCVPQALFCAYDYMAIGAMRCIYDHGDRVPEDVKIISVDDIEEAKFLHPRLSSISEPTEEICACAVEKMLKMILEASDEKRVVFKSKLILRESSEI